MMGQTSPLPGRAQTNVYAASKPPQQKQRAVRRTKLLPNLSQKQQKNATSPTLLGYARVSKAEDQDTAPQIEALHAAGCQRVYEERVSGGRWDRPELHRLLDRLGPSDVLTVWKLDRLSRSLKDLLLILDKVEKAGAGFRSLTEHIDSTTASGRMMMQMLGAFAEFERAMVRERTQAGLRSARAQGRRGGRQPKLSPEQQTEVLTMLTAGRSAADVARLFRVHRATISRIANNARV
jgi:DNA invertase Pin-like site-specific DNA recombinase